MSTATRIDELRKKFEENPRRYFAPLANEYRKTGDLAQAIALCREHLPKQPGHMSGYIVFGQALFEAGELVEARDVFEQAIDLDPENLIALRHLGEIAKAHGDVESARRWWGRVYDADPRNDDIAAQLATLSSAPTPVATPAIVPSFELIARGSETPAFPMAGIGFGVAPTPDSVMRAIDMDAVHASMQNQEPIDLDADDEAVQDDDLKVNSLYSAAEASAAIEAATDDLGSSPEEVVPDVVVAAAAHELPSIETHDEVADPFDFPDSPVGAATDAHGELSGVGDSPDLGDDALEDAFEEGLVAAEWPDTSELVARVLTPRSATPRSATPLSSDVLEDVISAFGGERGESPLVSSTSDASVNVPEDAPVEDRVVVSFDVAAEMVALELPAMPPEEAVQSATDESFMSALDQDEEQLVDTGIDSEWHAEPPVEVSADLTVEVESEAHELPWLAMPAPGTEATDEEIENADPGLEAIAEAFAEDARSAGDDGPMTVAAFDDSLPNGESESFADVAQQLIEDEAVEPAGYAEAEAPAFVTETMGELLVSQGFLARAIDVYGELVRRRPYDPVLASRLEELQGMLHASVESAPPRVDEPAIDEPAIDEPSIDEVFSAELEATFAPEAASEFASEFTTEFPGAEQALPTPTYGTPAFGLHRETPRVTPYAQPSVFDDSPARRSAREWFAAIAARRVPRRTPSQSTAAVAEEAPDGLATLFGTDASAHDDAAARALADAFAPVTPQEIDAGSTFDFDVRQATPAFSPAITPPRASSLTPAAGATGFTAARGPSITPVTGSNAGFSFDRFFPDPAMRRVTPAPSSPTIPDAPVTDDLAQFSAWLKGLGNQ